MKVRAVLLVEIYMDNARTCNRIIRTMDNFIEDIDGKGEVGHWNTDCMKDFKIDGQTVSHVHRKTYLIRYKSPKALVEKLEQLKKDLPRNTILYFMVK